MSDMIIVSGIIIFLASLSFLNLLMPTALQFISITDLAWFGGGSIVVAGACVVAPAVTGAILCPIALVGYAVGTIIINYFQWQSTSLISNIISLIVSIISIIMVIFIARLARGNG